MMVTLEQIDELRKRVNVSYEEAKKTLEKNDGDLIKSIIELEKKKGRKE
jgi:NACalpha-BTF3-like transcription factor